MPNYIIKARNTSAVTEVPVTADSREAAILEIAKTAKEGEQMEVMSCVEVLGDAVAPKHASHAADDKHAKK